MKKQTIIIGSVALSALLILLLVQRKHTVDLSSVSNNGSNQDGASHPDQPPTKNTAENSSDATTATNPAAKEKANDCFQFAYQHQPKNQNRDIEDFLNDTNAFPLAHANVNQKSICVKVNDKPVNHKLVKKDGKAEVVIGSVVGPESTIQVSYCIGSAPCKEACAVKTKNKVDELLSDSEMGGLENAELETQVKELRNVASVHGDLMDSAVIRDWTKLQSKEWVCSK